MRSTACSSRSPRWSSAARQCCSFCWRCWATTRSAACSAARRSRFEPNQQPVALLDDQFGDVEAERRLAALRLEILHQELHADLELRAVRHAFEIDPDRCA